MKVNKTNLILACIIVFIISVLTFFLQNTISNESKLFVSKKSNEIKAEYESQGFKTVKFKDEKMAKSVYGALPAEAFPENYEYLSGLELPILETVLTEKTELTLRNAKESDKITNIEGIENFRNLTSLKLAENLITDISPIQYLTKLTSLDLNGNKNISDISYLQNNTELQILNLEGNKIDNLEAISKLYKLTTLKIGSNQITSSDIEDISNLSNLTVLDANNNEIEDILPILQLLNLTELNLNSNKIQNLEGISKLRKLEKLNLGDNRLKKSQVKYIFEGIKVKYFKDADDKMIIVAEYDEKLENYVKNENYNEADKSNYKNTTIARLNNLYYLNVELNNMTDLFIDTNIQYMKNLKEVYAQSNEISELTNIYRLENLEVLNLNNNNIENISPIFKTYKNDDEIYILYLQKFTSISLDDNDIEYIYVDKKEGDIEVRYSFANFKNLNSLNLSRNRIYNISTIAYKKFNSIQLFEQDINISLMKRELDDDFQELILPEIFLYTLEKDSNVYSTNEFSYTNCSKTSEDEKITDRSIAFVDSNYLATTKDPATNKSINATVRINGGFADGTVLTIKPTSTTTTEGGLETITFTDSNLYKAVKENLFKYTSDKKILDELWGYYDKYNIINIYYKDKALKDFKELDASNRNIENVDGIKRLTALTKINISNNKITDISEIALLPNITKLNIGANKIENILNFNYVLGVANRINKQQKETSKLACYKSIQELSAYTNNIDNFNSIKNCTELTNLNLMENKITDITTLSNLKNLQILNLTDNYIDNIEVIKNFEKLEELSLGNNHGKIGDEDLGQLLNLPLLTKLELQSNYLKDISSLNSITSLRTLILNDNLIEDINLIKNLTRLGNLDLGQNKISDLTGINRFTQLTRLILKKNRIKDDTKLSTLTSLVTLDISYNKLEDISTIEILDKTYNLDEIILNDQIITIELTEEQTKGMQEIELPELFAKSLETDNLVFTTKDFKTNNCAVDTDRKLITLSELGTKIAWVNIEQGLAQDSKVVISEPLKGRISYSTEEKTKDNVQATVTFNRASVSVNNNDGKTTYIFTENGEFTFEFEDDYGFIGTVTAKVDWIDNRGPNATVTLDKTAITKESVIATITTDEECKEVKGWNISEDKKILTKIYTENANEKISLEDELGNKTEIDVIITNIDKVVPKIEGVEEGKTYKQSVKPIITEANLDTIVLTKDKVKVENYKNNDIISSKGQYKLTVTDKAGNKIEVSFTVEIDSQSDTLEIGLKQNSTYEIDQEEKYIKNINPNTTIQTAINNIETNGEIKVYKETTEITNKETKIGTGMTIKVSKGTEERIYTVIVKGDCNGSGTTNVADLTKLMMSRAESLATNKDESKILKGIYEIAVDLNEDGKISIGDITKLSIFIAENK